MKTNKIIFLFAILMGSILSAGAQNPTQTVRGTVMDKESHSPVSFAIAAIYKDSIALKISETDDKGNFRMEDIPVGRYTLKIQLMGYRPIIMSGLVVSSAKEVVLTLSMEEAVVTTKEITVKADTKNKVRNDMATVSVRPFTVEETNRYAGSRADPARMASNFAGVSGADDSRNDIIIRGNSPMGVLYRFENVDIPNPNHFAVAGTSGGPTSILNNKVIDNSDFLTGAFPAEYGNALAGVFDVKMRNGNSQKNEFSAQFGVLGAELAAEGPISKGKESSYLAVYRYSTLRMLNSLHLPIGTDAIPNYQDGAFKLNFPINTKSSISLFGMGGYSNIDIIVSTKKTAIEDLYSQNDRDQYFGSGMGVAGLTYNYMLSKNAYMKLTLSASLQHSHAHHDLVNLDSADKVHLTPLLGYNFNQTKQSVSWFVSKKFNARHSIKTGLFADLLGFDLTDSLYDLDTKKFIHRWDYKGNHLLIQPYIEYKFKITEKLTLNTGVHGQYFSLNNTYAVEPRAAMQWAFAKRQALSLGYGLHSQLQPTYIYFYNPTGIKDNLLEKNMDFTKSHHLVFGYDNKLTENLRLHFEAFYQQLFNVPVDYNSSSFSLLNQGSSFSRFFPESTLVNKGTGSNKGIELTLEKGFSHGYFAMFSGSLYDSKYKGSDGVERNTDFNGNYAANLLGGKEFNFGRKTLTLGGKITYAGGRRYSPADTAATIKAMEIVAQDNARNSLQYHPYFRADLKIAFKINARKLTHEIGLDLVNILDTKNFLTRTYVPNLKDRTQFKLRDESQLGFLPLFYYKVDFYIIKKVVHKDF